MKSVPESYKPAEACRIAEVAPYVLRYWETEFPALSEGKEKGGARLYSGRDVKIIARIRELLYDEGFTVAGAKKRLEAEIREGRFDDGGIAAPVSEWKKRMEKPPAAPTTPVPSRASAPASASEPLFLKESGPPASDIPDRKAVIRELKEIAKLLDRPRRA
jgi:DNA-binding transcriptional MerR regulator